MSEQNAQCSENNVNINTNNSIESNGKRKKQSMDSQIAKHSKNNNNSNYYYLLDIENDKQCNRDLLNKFQHHVKETKEKSQKLNSAIAAMDEMNRISKNNQTSNPIETSTVVNRANNNNKKVPPLNIIDIETKELIEFLKNGLKINDFKIKEFRNKKSLYLNSLDDFLRVRAYLEKTKTNFYTFTPKGIKTKTYLLKGLDANISPDEILNELNKFKEEDLQFVKVSNFSTKKSIEKGYNLSMFLVQITPDTNINKLKRINALFYRCVKWEQIRRPDIPQCRNCQGFFHSAANCFLPSRCVKCDKTHEKGKCETTTVSLEEKEKLFCVLCSKYGHPASYKGCEKYKELQEKFKAKKKIKMDYRTNNINYLPNSGTTFANVLKGNNNPNVNISNQNLDTNNSFLIELKNMMLNLNNQIASLQKQIQLQATRIDTIFSMINV